MLGKRLRLRQNHFAMNWTALGLLAIGGALALLFLWLSLRLRRRQRLLHDLPTSSARGVFVGLVELKGTAACAAPLTGFLSGARCVQFHYEVQEHWSRTVTETVRDKDGKTSTRTRHESGWTTVAQGGSATPFFVCDETGQVLVRPDGADIEPLELFEQTVGPGDPLYYDKGPAMAVANSDHRRRFTETGIPVEAALFVVGRARERQDVVAPEIVADPEAELFLISAKSEERVQRGQAAGSWALWVLALLGAAGGAAAATWKSGALAWPEYVRPVLLAMGVLLAAWALGWVWMVFNSLVNLRQRVRQAWSLIDVQLKRRHDLIPNLVAMVAALQSHEREVQEALAALRTQLGATPPGATGPDFDGLAGSLRAVVERYPALVAQEGFARLHRELVETEQRIALARGYYNEIATQFATRLERIPDRFVGAIVRLRPQPLLEAGTFERAPVPVGLAPSDSARV